MSKRERSERIVVELVDGGRVTAPGDDDGYDDAGGPAVPVRAGPGEVLRDLGGAALGGAVRLRARVARHRAVSLVATGTAAAVVLTVAGVGTARENERIEVLRATPGGVESLDSAPREAWRYVMDRPAASPLRWLGMGAGVTAMGPNAVFLEGEQREPRGTDLGHEPPAWKDADLVAVDVHSGREAWRVPLGPDAECSASDGRHALRQMVCLIEADGARSSVVVTADGAVSEPHELDEDADERYGEAVAGPAGLVVRGTFEGERPEIDCSDAVLTPQDCEVTGGADRTTVVRAEDARTGDEVWTARVPWAGEDLTSCMAGDYRLDQGPQPADMDLDALTVHSGGELVQVGGCGVELAFLPDGTSLEGWAGTSDDGRYVTAHSYDPDEMLSRTTIRTADGEPFLEVEGTAGVYGVDDGTPSDTVMVTVEDGSSVQGFRRDGTRAWAADETAPGLAVRDLIARVGDVGVFSTPGTAVLGLDIRSGKPLWELRGADHGLPAVAGHAGAFTDGRSVLVVYPPEPGSVQLDPEGTATSSRALPGIDLAAIDAASGRLRWQARSESWIWLAIDGRLLSVTDDGALVGYDAG